MTKFLLPCLLVFSGVSMLAFEENGPSSSAATVLLTIDGKKLTLGDLEQKKPTSLFQARNAFYEAERTAVEDFITDYLLEQQAKKEGITVAELLERHVNGTIAKDPGEESLRVYYEGIDTKESFEAVKDRILEQIRRTRIAKAKVAYLQTLRGQAEIAYNLVQPRAAVATTNALLRGPAGAPVTIVEYADYECPYCQQVQPALDKIEAEYKGRVSFAYKDMPLPMHPHAEKAAEATHCAAAQGKYWEYHDQLFVTKALDVPQLKEGARALKLDAKAFDDCLDSGKELETIKAQVAESQSLQIQGTPTFFINGRFLSGVSSYENLRTVIEEELAAAARPAVTAQR